MARRWILVAAVAAVLVIGAGVIVWATRPSAGVSKSTLDRMTGRRGRDLQMLARHHPQSTERLECIELQQDDLGLAAAIGRQSWPRRAESAARVAEVALQSEAHTLRECAMFGFGADQIVAAAPDASPALERLRELLPSDGSTTVS